MKRHVRQVLLVCAVAGLAGGAGYQVARTHPHLRSALRKCAMLVAPHSVYAQGVTLLWSANMEPISPATGASTLGAWYLPNCCEGDDVSPPDPNENSNGGGVSNSGIASAGPSFDYNHTAGGNYSAMLKIDTSAGESGTRLFRWLQPQTYGDLYYGVWYYFPQYYSLTGNFWNVLQWKSNGVSEGNHPFYSLNVYPTTYNGNQVMGLCLVTPSSNGSCMAQTPPYTFTPYGNGQWTHVEAHYVCAPDNTGHVTIWQDSNQLFDVSGPTSYPDGDCEWSVDNYSDGLSPTPATIYIDDAEICQGGRCP